MMCLTWNTGGGIFTVHPQLLSMGDRKVSKRYRAAVHGRLEGSGKIDSPISGKHALTRWAAVAHLPAAVMGAAQTAGNGTAAVGDGATAAQAAGECDIPAASSGAADFSAAGNSATGSGAACDAHAVGPSASSAVGGRDNTGLDAAAADGGERGGGGDGGGDAAQHVAGRHAEQEVTILDLWPHTGVLFGLPCQMVSSGAHTPFQRLEAFLDCAHRLNAACGGPGTGFRGKTTARGLMQAARPQESQKPRSSATDASTDSPRVCYLCLMPVRCTRCRRHQLRRHLACIGRPIWT